ncbi:MAG: succinate dehydrogenase / fumarate reductase iron-sulfur subunit [Bradymonadia bacterium]|jgi:succinate dehydrogenase / fumarate reductase iron-sulfur subunit
MSDTKRVNLRIWRQNGPNDAGRFEEHQNVETENHASFLEMLDVLNERLITEGKDPVVFAHDCREGICGTCGFVVNGLAHGPEQGTTVCQLHMFKIPDGATLTLEPWRAKAFPVIKDLMVDRSAFDRIQQAGGYNSTNVGNAPEANSILVGQSAASEAFDAATCIGCGACVAACPNASAMLFTSAKVGQYSVIPQGQPERAKRAISMVTQHDHEGFGACTNTLECEAACPKEISTGWIQRLHREYVVAAAVSEEPV